MAVRYQALLGPADDDDTQEHEGALSPLSPGTSTSRSTTTTGLASPLPSPTPSNYLTLAEQTFTPLSMDDSDFGDDWADARGGHESKQTAAAVLARTGLLQASGAEKHSKTVTGGAPGGNVPGPASVGGGSSAASTSNLNGPSSSASTAPVSSAAAKTPDGRGAPIVSAMVQSFEALQAARAATGYQLISTKNTANNHRHPDPGLVSPPPTVSPSLSPSPLSRSPAPDQAEKAALLPAHSVSPGTYRDVAPGATVASAALKTPATVAPQDWDENENAVPTLATRNRPGTTTIDAENPLGLSTPFHAIDFAAPAPLSVAAKNTIVRPTPVSSPPRTPQPALNPVSTPSPTIVRTSSSASLTLNHPTPDPNRRSRSGAYLGNIAALEATAERLSMTSSIENAIREEHNELKRSDSRRSSILRASSINSGRKTSGSDGSSAIGAGHLSVASRQSSIVGLNTAARLGGYSPGGYIMSPHTSMTGGSARLRSASKASSIGAPTPSAANLASSEFSPEVGNGEDFLFLSRSGPGKASTRSVASKLSHVEAAELDHPSSLNKHAFDEADRAAAAGEDPEDDDTIRASAYQHIEGQFADDDDREHTDASQPMLDHGFFDEPGPRLQLHEPGSNVAYREEYDSRGDGRPMTSGSGATYDQAQAAFGDFDGVHCDPEADDFAPPPMPELVQERPKPHGLPPPRPKSYFDPSTGQQMLFYPAPVPAMLNLPPKLSKKPKAAVRNVRRSQVLSVMPQDARDSRVWLPDPVQGLRGSRDSLPLMTELMGDSLGPSADQAPPQVPGPQGEERSPLRPAHSRQASETSTILAPAEQPPTTTTTAAAGREIRRPQRLTERGEKRKTRATVLDGLPPQLRASAFFDLPSTTQNIEIKGGSATATLDSILDASAAAPVSAFTDHAFAGKLGNEVYGAEKKKKKKKGANRDTMMATQSTTELLQPGQVEKRTSKLSLFGGRHKRSDDMDAEGFTTVGLVGGEDGMNRDGSVARPEGPLSPNELAPDSDERSSDESSEEEEEEEEDEDELFQGPPTTLLAELQIRKQRNKLRTRPMAHAYTNGMHSTLLELDAVAEVERKARQGKRVNLAWEDPNANLDHTEDQDDDDVPLGMLFVAKANGLNSSTMDISAVMSEVNRPLGLMERRELEDNEPLSRRRERIVGQQTGLVPPTLDLMQQRISHLGMSPYGSTGALGLRSQSRLGLPLPSPGAGSRAGSIRGAPDADADAEPEGETLAARKARLAAEDPLPRARPVSGMFSSELLSQFGGDDERPPSTSSKGKGKAVDGKISSTGDVPEEEETLGQRRRRLQAEREAREREMATGGLASTLGFGVNPAASRVLIPNAAANVDPSQLSRRLSMADMLNAHPLEAARGTIDPREEDRLRREAEAAHVQRDKDAKMAALRAQMPTTLTTPMHGARTGGYMNGVYNDGLGGNPNVGFAYGGMQRMSTMPAGGVYGGMPQQYGMGVTPGYGVPLQNGQGVDMVERWRQGVMN
ncbi:hypothetical protein OQA88_2056 [Cercophora sp. LCS_1]